MRTWIGQLTAVLALLAGACTPLQEVPGGETACVDICLAGTRLTGVTTADETRINRWCVFLAEEGRIVTFGTAQGNGPVSGVAIREGRYTLLALANYPEGFDPGSFRLLDEVTAHSFPLEDNAQNALLMYGERADVEITAATGTVSIPAERLCARVTVKRVTLDFSAREVLAAQSFRLQEMYLSNVYARTCLHLGEPWSMPYTDYYNKWGTATFTNPLVYESLGLSLSSGQTHSTAHHFYTWPNGTPSEVDDENRRNQGWTGHRCTRLVLKALLGGETRYYVVDLPGISRNCLYTIEEIILRGRGSSDPEVPSEEIDVYFSTTGPGSWDGTPDYTVTENA